MTERAQPDEVDRDRRDAVSRRSSHPSPTVWLIAAALAVLLGGLPANTEIIFHRRDHLDQGKYLSNQHVYNVKSYSDALVSHIHRATSAVLSNSHHVLQLSPTKK